MRCGKDKRDSATTVRLWSGPEGTDHRSVRWDAGNVDDEGRGVLVLPKRQRGANHRDREHHRLVTLEGLPNRRTVQRTWRSPSPAGHNEARPEEPRPRASAPNGHATYKRFAPCIRRPERPRPVQSLERASGSSLLVGRPRTGPADASPTLQAGVAPTAGQRWRAPMARSSHPPQPPRPKIYFRQTMIGLPGSCTSLRSRSP